MYANQITMLHTLNLYSAVCQLYLNKTGRKRERESLPFLQVNSAGANEQDLANGAQWISAPGNNCSTFCLYEFGYSKYLR